MSRVCSFAVFYKLPNTQLPKTYIRPVLTSLLTAICIILSTWLISNSYNTGKSALPDIYALALGRCAPEGECVYIRQSTSACVISNIFHFRHSQNLPKLDATCSAALYSNRYWL